MRGWMIYVFVWFLVGIYIGNANLDKSNTNPIPRRSEVAAKVKPIPASREGRGRICEVAKGLTMTATAYTHTGHPTASGKWPKAGRTIAVNPAKFKMGERVYIKGFGWRIAEDVIPPGSIKKGADIDIFVDSEFEAKKHGREAVEIVR